MNEKIEKLIEKIKSGKNIDSSNFKFSLEEYLSKDEDGITFLEHLLKNNIDIYYFEEQKIKKSIEVALIYSKYNKSLWGFTFTEDELFSNVNGERFIDFLFRKNDISSDVLNCIKNHIEIIDLLIENNMKYSVYHINEELVKKLLIKDNSGTYPIEKYIDNEDIFPQLINLVNEPGKIIDICKKHNKYNLLRHSNENVLLYEVEKGRTLLQELCDNKIIPYALLTIPKNIDFINYLRNNNFYKYLKDASEDILLVNISDDKTLLEDVLEKGYKPLLNTMIYEEKTIRILAEKYKLELVTSGYYKLLLKPAREVLQDKKINKKITLLEYMLTKNYNPLSGCYKISNEEIIKILCEKGYYNLLGEKISDEKLFTEINGALLLDTLLENSEDINFGYNGFTSFDIAQRAYKKGRLDILCKANLRILLAQADENNSYLHYVLQAIKNKKIKYNLTDISFFDCSAFMVASFYLILAKNDMIGYMPKLEEADLFNTYQKKTLLDALLDLDSALTLDKIISQTVKSNMKVAVILKSRGLIQDEIDIPLQEKNFSKEYLNKSKDNLLMGPILNEGQYLLNKLNELFIKDGKSDPELVNSLISGYRNALLVDYETNIKELRNLVKVKEENINKFTYNKTDKGAFFKRFTGDIHSDNNIISTLLHETGHALHSYLTNNKIPDNYDNLLESLRANPQVLKKVEMYANKCSEIKKEIESISEEKYKLFFESYYTEEKLKKIEEFLIKSKEEQKWDLKDLNLDSEVLDVILDESFNLEEYISHQKRIFIEEYTERLLRGQYGSFMVIGDILDAIYEGDLHSGILKNENGEKIKSTMGHGIYYYLNREQGFAEMVANFSSISKSTDSKEMLNLLKSIIGDELYNMISEFYYNNIANNELETNKTL